jgi:hypothetical protein
LISVWP